MYQPEIMTFNEWTDPTSCPPLDINEVHIWWMALDLSENIFEHFQTRLHHLELKRAKRLRIAEHRKRYIAGRAMLRLLLSGYLDVPSEDVQLEYGPLGKPAIPERSCTSRLHFNYSDSVDMAVYAFALGREVGIDLEHLSRRVDHDRIAERKFCADEAVALRGLPEEQRRQAFLACWTRKEAYGKAEGVGIHYPLDSINLCSEGDAGTLRIPKANGADDSFWTLKQLYPHPDYVGAVVAEGAGWDITGWTWQSHKGALTET